MTSYTIGENLPLWGGDDTQTITFIVTSDCNLRCKYCYVVAKENNKRMHFSTAKKFIDYLMSDKLNRSKKVVLDFIGGEPLLEIELIDKICDYFKIKAFELSDEWYWQYRINICSNGLLYEDEKVQNFIKKNIHKISFGISIDGNKQKHDLNRVKVDGSGSYDDIMRILPLWKQQFVPSTKVTFSSPDLIYLKDSILALWDLGIYDVAANVVYEDVWNTGDDKILEQELMSLADHIIDKELYDKGYKCTFFMDFLGGFNTQGDLNSIFCGAGKMLAIDCSGNIYPCIRFSPNSLSNKKAKVIGNIEKGLDKEKLRTYACIDASMISSQECIECPVAKGCPYCQGFNYDESKNDTIFNRTVYHCLMQKARVRTNDYFFAKLYNQKGITRENYSSNHQYLYFILSDDYVSFCQFENKCNSHKTMNQDLIQEGLNFCRENFYKPVFIHSNELYNFESKDFYDSFIIEHIIPIQNYEHSKTLKNVTYVIEPDTLGKLRNRISRCIFNINQDQIDSLYKFITEVFKFTDRVNLNVIGLNENFQEDLYQEQLMQISDYLVQCFKITGEVKEINVLNDVMYEDTHENCKAGDRLFAFAPNGRFYICPSFYSNNKNDVGCLENGINFDNKLFNAKSHFLCKNCKANQCLNCVYLNKESTDEFNVSPSYQCRKSNIELNVAYELQKRIPEAFINSVKLEKVKNLDPIISAKPIMPHFDY